MSDGSLSHWLHQNGGYIISRIPVQQRKILVWHGSHLWRQNFLNIIDVLQFLSFGETASQPNYLPCKRNGKKAKNSIQLKFFCRNCVNLMSAFDKFLMVVLAIELLLSLPLAQQAVPTWPSTKVELDGKSFSPQIGMDDAAKFFRSYGLLHSARSTRWIIFFRPVWYCNFLSNDRMSKNPLTNESSWTYYIR